MNFQGFVGGGYLLKSPNVDSQRCVNLYPEKIESGTGKEAQVAYLKSTPGLKKIMTLGDGPIRMIYSDQPPTEDRNNPTRVFVASGNKLFRLEYDGATWSSLEIPRGISTDPQFLTTTGPILAASLDVNLGQVAFVDGLHRYIYVKDGVPPTPTERCAPVLTDEITPTHIAFLDSFLVCNNKGFDQFYVSDWNSLAVDPLSYASAEGDPDKIMGLIVNQRYLWIMNERTTELWSNTGNADFPFERVSGGFVEIGCLARYSIQKIDGAVFWLGRDQFGQGSVYMATSLNPQRISTHAIEYAISTYADPGSATAFTYKMGGHSFYELNFAEATWVFDLSTGLWHERAYTNEDGDLERHRAECHAYVPQYGLHLVGDYENGNIYTLDENTYDDDSAPITRMRVAPHVSGSLKRMFHHSLQIDMETGVGLDGSVQGSDPQAMLDWSDDGGHTWSNETLGSIGKKVGGIGTFKTRLIWRRLGSAYDRVYRLKITDPVPVTIIGAQLDAEAGVS